MNRFYLDVKTGPKDEKLQSKYACADQPSAPGCRTDGTINRCMGSVSATSGPDTEHQVPDEILQNFGMKTSFSKDVPKLSIEQRSERFLKLRQRTHTTLQFIAYPAILLSTFCLLLSRIPTLPTSGAVL